MFGMDLKRTVFLFGGVNTWSAETTIGTLLEMDKTEGELNVVVNSNGGSAADMFGIIDTLSVLKNKVNTIVLGMGASAGAGISIAGTGKRLMSKNSELMVHGAQFFAVGNTEEVQKRLDAAKKDQEKYFKIIAEKSNMSVDQLKEKTSDNDWYMSAEEALSSGFIDAVLSEEEYSKLKLSEKVESAKRPLTDDQFKEIHLLQVGKHETGNYGELNIELKDIQEMVDNFKSGVAGRDISIDYSHDNDTGEKKAAAWVKDLKVKNNGLYAVVEYTPEALKMVKDKEYQYASSEYVPLNYKNHEGKFFDMVLLGGTLTNRPAIKKLEKLKLSEKENEMELKDFKKEDLFKFMKDTHGVDFADLTKKNDSLTTDLKKANDKITVFETEAEKLKEAKLLAEKETAFSALQDTGMVVAKTKEKVMAQFKDAKSMQEFYEDMPAVLNVESKGDGSAKEAATEARLEKLAEETGHSKEDLKKNL